MTFEELDLQCDRLEAAQACRNLVGRLSYYTSAFRMRDLLALWDPSEDARLTLPTGQYQGYDAISEALLRSPGDRNDPGMDTALKGALHIHNVNSDLLTIREDCQQAEGVWYSPGLETDLYDPADPAAPVDKAHTDGLEPSARYVWRTYHLVFVRREGDWKIQQLQIRTIFDTPFDTPWTLSQDTIWAADRVIETL